MEDLRRIPRSALDLDAVLAYPRPALSAAAIEAVVAVARDRDALPWPKVFLPLCGGPVHLMARTSSTRSTPVRVDMVQKSRRAQRASRQPMLEELGTTGLRHYGGFVVEEWLGGLRGRRGALAYREMADNDSVVGALLFAIEMMARGVPWDVRPGADAKATMLIETAKDDMSGTWADFIAEVWSMATYGWALPETVYKRRLGPDPGNDADGEPLPGSRYDDGLIGWRKMPIRAQETLESWDFAPDGGLKGMSQLAYDGIRRYIPIEKALLFRTTTKRGNPEGRSLLRNAFVSWFRKKTIEEIEAIGVERDLAGIPVVRAPQEGFVWNEDEPQSKALIDAARDLATSIRRDEDEGVVLPPGWALELLTTGGSRQLDTDAIIETLRRADRRDDPRRLDPDGAGLRRLLRSLGTAKIETFADAMQAWLGSIAEVLNRYAIPRLLRLNGMSVIDPPEFVPGRVRRADVEKLTAFLEALNRSGAPIDWSHDLLAKLFELAGLPEPEESPTGEEARGGAGADAYDDPPPTDDEKDPSRSTDPRRPDTVEGDR